RAINEFETVLRDNPNDASARQNLGTILSQIPGREGDAIVQWRLALQIDPKFAPSHYSLGLALAQLPGRRAEAIAELEAAHQLTKDPQTQLVIDRLKAAGN